jgi:hypothetical protein
MVNLPKRSAEEEPLGAAVGKVLREAAVLAPLWVPVFAAVGAAIVYGYNWIENSNIEIHTHLDKVDARLVTVDRQLGVLDAGQLTTNEYLRLHTQTIDEAKRGEAEINRHIAGIEAHQAADELHWGNVEHRLDVIVGKLIPDRRADDAAIVPTGAGKQ